MARLNAGLSVCWSNTMKKGLMIMIAPKMGGGYDENMKPEMENGAEEQYSDPKEAIKEMYEKLQEMEESIRAMAAKHGMKIPGEGEEAAPDYQPESEAGGEMEGGENESPEMEQAGGSGPEAMEEGEAPEQPEPLKSQIMRKFGMRK